MSTSDKAEPIKLDEDAEIRKATQELAVKKAREYLDACGGSYPKALIEASRENMELKANILQMRQLLEKTNGVIMRLMDNEAFAKAMADCIKPPVQPVPQDKGETHEETASNQETPEASEG